MSHQPVARSFDLSEVTILDDSIHARQDRNREYLLSLDIDRLLHNFRINAGLATSAKPLGGWEAPDHGLRGHFVGHFISACSLLFSATREEELKNRVNVIVGELAKCQQAMGGSYLSAFPESDLAAIETKFEGVWASYYVLHKIFAGLVDAHRYCGNAQALEMATRLASYVRDRLAKLSHNQLEKMLRTDKPNPTNETGGWSETLQDLFTITHNPEHLHLAHVFDRDWFFDPLIRGEDRLTGLHANTHIPMALGAAKRYELTGDARYRDAVIHFWEQTALARSYVNGGSSGPRPDGAEKSKGGEHWPAARKLAHTLTPKINESCVTHNMMRLTDTLFRWTADARYADFYERAYFNSLLCMQHPHRIGGYIYDHPLSSCSHKTFGHANDTFWCCYGSSIEAHARLATGIYYHNDDTLWVNLPIASKLEWKEKGLTIEQRTAFPFENETRLVFRCENPVGIALELRVPAWTDGQIIASVDGVPLDLAEARKGMFWTDGMVLTVKYPMHLHAESMPDDDRLIAFLYGPMVLAAMSDEELILNAESASEAVSIIQRVEDEALNFRIKLHNGREVLLVPLNRIADETFGVYFRIHPKDCRDLEKR